MEQMMPVTYEGNNESGRLEAVPSERPITEESTAEQRNYQAITPPHGRSSGKQPSRLTVVERVYHQPAGQDAVAFESPFYRFLSSEDTCYNRSLTVTPEWQQIDLAWVAKPAMLYLANEGRAPAGLDVIIGIEPSSGLDPVPVARIPAGESARLCPVAGAVLYAICPLGSGRLRVVAIPE